ncbi:hypothetical protein BDZ85DRAFT_264469 [Elsinoe ampelina]|uniref:Uncharacterized protein n=1 Tax=Elsinoe ampelina TaxID=302913 RepID=A0A6A6G7U2_9PEZI|nr:hypothetical protein BDZ85DRAFT_264469 [Elsinoe ampelina]
MADTNASDAPSTNSHDLQALAQRPDGTFPSTSDLPTTLPSLNYTVRTRPRLWWMAIFWTVTLIDSCILPITLYFTLHNLTSLSPNTVFSIVTGAIGGLSIVEYAIRSWRLWKPHSTCRPLGDPSRWAFDFFHWIYSFAWLICMVELIVGSVPDEPYMRLLALVPATFLYVFGIQFLLFDFMARFGIRSPVAISSQPRGEVPRNAVFTLVEDVVAVDGAAGTEYRERLAARYKASETFRAMMQTMTMFWGWGALGTAVLTTVLAFALENKEVAYTQGWSVPFVWAMLWAAISWRYVERMLRVEREVWRGSKDVPV